jgi:thiaminase/transcriptional activator TenA
MSERFTEMLRASNEPAWSDAVGHRFVKDLFAGAVPGAVMARYLIQDHRFLDSFLTLLGAALASADTFKARLRFGRFIGLVSGEENTYFLRAFAMKPNPLVELYHFTVPCSSTEVRSAG